MATLVKDARPARALSSAAGISPRVCARWTRYAAALAVMRQQRRSQDTVRPAFGERAASGMEAVHAPEPLSLEPIDGQADLDDVGTHSDDVKPSMDSADERIDVVTQALSHIRHDERFHAHHLPNICSPPYGSNTDKVCRCHVTDIKGHNTHASANAHSETRPGDTCLSPMAASSPGSRQSPQSPALPTSRPSPATSRTRPSRTTAPATPPAPPLALAPGTR